MKLLKYITILKTPSRCPAHIADSQHWVYQHEEIMNSGPVIRICTDTPTVCRGNRPWGNIVDQVDHGREHSSHGSSQATSTTVEKPVFLYNVIYDWFMYTHIFITTKKIIHFAQGITSRNWFLEQVVVDCSQTLFWTYPVNLKAKYLQWPEWPTTTKGIRCPFQVKAT